MRKNPRHFDGPRLTSHRLDRLLPEVLKGLSSHYAAKPGLVLETWPDLVGPQIAAMSQAVSFVEGVLTVKVRSSSLYSLLSQYERPKLLKKLRERFPKTPIKSLTFRIG